MEFLNPHDDRQLPNGSDEVLLGSSCQRVQDFDAVCCQEFYNSPKLLDSQLRDGGVLENKKDDVASLGFPVVDPLWFWYEQMQPVKVNLVPSRKNVVAPVELRLGTVLQNNRPVQVFVAISANLESIWSDDFPSQVGGSGSRPSGDGEVVDLAHLYSGGELLKHLTQGADFSFHSPVFLMSFWCGHNHFELEVAALLAVHVANVEVSIFLAFLADFRYLRVAPLASHTWPRAAQGPGPRLGC